MQAKIKQYVTQLIKCELISNNANIDYKMQINATYVYILSKKIFFFKYNFIFGKCTIYLIKNQLIIINKILF